jgi:hypothetical protein
MGGNKGGRKKGSKTRYLKPLDELKKVLREEEAKKVKRILGQRIKRAIDRELQ